MPACASLSPRIQYDRHADVYDPDIVVMMMRGATTTARLTN